MSSSMSEETLMKAAAFDAVDFVYSDNGGHIVVVSVLAGVHVCQQCGEPFDNEGPDRRWRMVEKKNELDASVPIGVHAKCFNPPIKAGIGLGGQLRKIAAGVREKKVAVKALAYADHLSKVAAEAAKKIIL